jgi:endonuclease/exonuclease/phosphatase family metal-dependent hydrolase
VTAATQLAVISSNIRYDEPQDKQHRWENRRDFLARCLLDFSPDLLATQEGKRPQLQDIAARLKGLSCADEHRQWQASLMYPCIFYNPDTLTLRDSGDIWLSQTPTTIGSSSFGSQYPRLCTWALFDNDLLAINVHLDDLKSNTRLCQIRVLMEQIDALQLRGQILLMGDFNESPLGGVRALIEATWPTLRDPWQELGRAEEPSHHGFLESLDYASRVDWILTDTRLQPQDIFLDKSCSERGIFPSDHYLLKARLLMPV